MAHVFLLNSTVVFWPERNVLYAKSDETKRITLSNPATRCLLLLIQQQGQVIERDYFFEHVWYINGAQVTNNTFYQNISLLRRAFKELGLNEELIVTVPKVGIRLEPQLEVLEQKIEEPLSDLCHAIGNAGKYSDKITAYALTVLDSGGCCVLRYSRNSDLGGTV